MIKATSWLVVLFVLVLNTTLAIAAPVPQNLSASMNEDGGSRNVTLRATGASRNETVTYSIVRSPTIGRVSLAGNIATYTPNANANGTDTFTYRATGSSSGASTTEGTVTISIAAKNDIPIATSGITATTNEDTAVTIQLGGTDVDGNTLKCYAVSAMAGTFTVDANSCRGTFTPTAHYTGTTQATYKVYDGTAYSPSVSVSITVNPTNVAPVATNISSTSAEDNSVMINLSATDEDHDALTYSVVSNPAHGTTSFFDVDTVIYTPAANYNGADEFTYRAYDGVAYSNTSTVSVSVSAVNDVPTANNSSAITNDQTSIQISLSGSDVDGDALSYRIVNSPDHGWAEEISEGVVEFRPDSPYSGSTSFTFSVNDGARSSNGTVTIQVSSVPQVHPMSVTTLENTPVRIYPVVSDIDSSTTTLSAIENPSHGRIVPIGAQEYQYTPDADYMGQDTFGYKAIDSDGNAQEGKIIISVMPDSGVASEPVTQLGLNFITFSPENDVDQEEMFDLVTGLGAQTIRQIGSADTIWSAIELADGADTADFGEGVRSQMQERGLQFVNSLYSFMFASCTPPWLDYTNPDEFVRSMDATCQDYLARAAASILEAQGDDDGVIYVEIGNELFHWISYNSTINYTPEEQAVVLQATSDFIRETIPNAVIVSPSVMLDDGASPEWKQRVEAAIGTDWYDIETIHDYEQWQNFPRNNEAFAERHVEGKLQYVTETCRSSDPNDGRTDGNTIEKKAAAVFQHPTMMWAAGFATVNWHAMFYSEEGDSEMDGCGFIYDDLSEDGAAQTYRLLSEEIVPFQQVVNMSTDDEATMLYQYRYANGSVKYVAWGSDTITVPAGMTQMTSVMPNADGSFNWVSVAPGSSVTLQDTPYLLK